MTDILKRQKDESFKAYLVRLWANKDEYGIDKYKIADLLNIDYGSNFDESKWRKDYYQYLNWRDFYISENLEEGIVKKYEELRIESEKEKIRKQDQKREYQKLIREQARIDHVREELIKEVKQLNKTKPMKWYERATYPNDENRESLLLLSDIHYGLFAQNYWNSFDNEEFKRRMKKLISKTITYSKENKVKTLHLFLLGDLINGLIHTITRINNTEDAVTQTIHISEILSEVITTLTNEFEAVKLYSVRGNHDRVTPNKKDEIAKESFNDLIPWYLKARLSHVQNLEFVKNEVDDEIIITNIADQTIFGIHGHKDKVSNVVQNLTLMTKVFPNYVAMGHTHHHEENEEHGVEVIVNSSFSGVDEYAKDIRKTSKPAQKLIIFDKDETRLTTYNIRLDLK
jgi:predicted phosphodiesterase